MGLRNWLKGKQKDKKIDSARRKFLKSSLAAAGALALQPFKVFADDRKYVEFTITKNSRTHGSLGHIVEHYCNLNNFLKIYGGNSLTQAIENLAKKNGIKNAAKVYAGNRIEIRIEALKKKYQFLAKKTIEEKIVEEEENRVWTNAQGFQSPFKGKKRPKLHKCYRKEQGWSRICPFDKFGADKKEGRSYLHWGLDLSCKPGTKLFPIKPGLIIGVGTRGFSAANGKTIKIKTEDGFEYLYLHLDEFYVKVGQKVNYSDLIGRSGATGNAENYRYTNPHVHIHLKYKGKLVDPLNYLSFLE